MDLDPVWRVIESYTIPGLRFGDRDLFALTIKSPESRIGFRDKYAQ